MSSLAYNILPLNRKDIVDVAEGLVSDEGLLQEDLSRSGFTYEQLRRLGEYGMDTVATFLFHQG